MSSSKRRRSRSPPEEGEIPSSQYCSRSDDSMRTRSDRFNSHSLLQCERLRATARLEKEASQESPKHEEGEIDNESSKSKRPMEVDGSAIASDKRTKTSNDIFLPSGLIKVFSEAKQKHYYVIHLLNTHSGISLPPLKHWILPWRRRDFSKLLLLPLKLSEWKRKNIVIVSKS